MFIPKPPKGKKIFGFDVNSLYPSVMIENLFLIGSPTYFEGDIFKQDSNTFWFFYSKIITCSRNKDLKHPILQIHHKTSNGLRTVSPLGSFEGMFFSEELKNALNFGYKFEVLRGYLFDRGYIFKDYVDSLYKLRLSYPKSDPLNYT